MKATLRFLWGPITTFINAFVFQTMWNWFLPQDPLALPPITFVHALGIATFLGFIINMSSGTTYPVRKAIDDGGSDEIFKHSFQHCCVLWFLSLGIGGLAYLAL